MVPKYMPKILGMGPGFLDRLIINYVFVSRLSFCRINFVLQRQMQKNIKYSTEQLKCYFGNLSGFFYI